MGKEIYNKLLKQMAAFCSRSEKCEFDVREKLKKTEINLDRIDELVNYLKETKYIDNERYAGFFANDKFKFNKWGKQKIRIYLKQKQIESKFIEIALKSIDSKEYIKTLKAVIEKKRHLTKENDKYKLKEKLIRNALSKGFEMELIYKLLD
jgi:regulatory protein